MVRHGALLKPKVAGRSFMRHSGGTSTHVGAAVRPLVVSDCAHWQAVQVWQAVHRCTVLPEDSTVLPEAWQAVQETSDVVAAALT
jgi:hypothetical protein